MNVLIVDDEPAVTNFFSRLATLRGCDRVDTVDTAEEAVTQVLRSTYDLITLDVRMPGVSGLEILAVVRNMNPHAVIAVISGYLPEEISPEVDSCIDVLVPKPVSVETFSALLDGARQLAETLAGIRLLGEPCAAAR